MHYNLFLYSPFTYSRLTGTTGELVGNGEDTYGVVYIKGGLKILESSEPDQIDFVTDEKNAFVPKWPGHSHLVAIEGDENGEAEWCCFSRNRSNNALTFTYQSVADSFALPANTAFVVISGEVTADGVTADADDYFRPRTEECLVTGNAEVVLITNQE